MPAIERATSGPSQSKSSAASTDQSSKGVPNPEEGSCPAVEADLDSVDEGCQDLLELFLVGRTEATLRTVADEIATGGGRAHVAVVDALHEHAVEEHARSVVEQAGGIDVSFNLTSRGDLQGTRLLDMDVDDFLRPITTGARSNSITARAAARHMVQRGSGVILMVTSGSGEEWTPPEMWPMGGTGPADAATESFMRYLAAAVGPRGVRAVCLWTAGVVLENDPLEAAKDRLVGMSMLRKRPTIQEFADTAAFLASTGRAAPPPRSST